MPDQPDELNILVPESRRAAVERMVTRRQALIAGGGLAAAAYLAGCGGSTAEESGGAGGAEEPAGPPTPADAPVEQGDLLLANWVDYSDPANYKGYTKEVGPKIKVSGFGSNEEILAKLRAGGSKYDVIAPSNNAVKTMADLGLIMPLTHDLIPNMKNISPAFTQSDYDPGNKYSVPKDYGITSFYWLTEKVDANPTTLAEAFELLKTPEFKEMRVNFLEGGVQLMALALAALGYSINTEEQSEIDEAKQLLIDVKPNVDTVNSTYIERASRGEIDFGMGWNGDVRRAIEALKKKDREMVFMVPEGKGDYWVDNWVISSESEHPVAAHKWLNYVLDPVVAGREMNYHQYAVPVEGIKGVDPALANDPIIDIPDEKIEGYEAQIDTARGLQQRNRAYTEFKAA
jgi:spermidine/putrescine transport system substrate-binding protein